MRYLIILFLIFPLGLSAQNIITGKVTSMVNQKPVMDASVFLSNTAIGSKTAADGTFNLSNIKNGKYDLVVTCIGYETYTENVTVYDDKLVLPTIQLMPKVTELREVKIGRKNGKISQETAALLRVFTREFLGATPNASQCKLLNPEMVDLIYNKPTDRLTAKSEDFLIVENKALGYRVKYLLNSFVRDPLNGIIQYTGVSVFEPMKGTPAQEADWNKKRVKAYLGSSMHFLRSCIANDLLQNDLTVFKLERTPNPDRPADSVILKKIDHFTRFPGRDSLVYWSKLFDEPRFAYSSPKVKLATKEFAKLTDQKGIYALSFPGILMVNYKYNVNRMNERSSIIIFKEENTYFDSNGVIFSMRNSKFEQYWSTLRVADQLPADYELPRSLK